MTVDLICLAQGNSRKQETSGGLEVLRVPMKHRRGGKLSYAFQYGSFIFISSLIFAWRSITTPLRSGVRPQHAGHPGIECLGTEGFRSQGHPGSA